MIRSLLFAAVVLAFALLSLTALVSVALLWFRIGDGWTMSISGGLTLLLGVVLLRWKNPPPWA